MAEWLTGPGLLWILLTVLVLAGGLALRQAHHLRGESGLPTGRIVFADTGNWRAPDKPLFSNTYGLTGKPDYLVKGHAGIIPIEVKSGIAPRQPYASHMFQLAAYCLLVEETHGKRPAYGLIRYANATIRVDYTPVVRRQLLTLLEHMRVDMNRQDVLRSHSEPARCAACGYVTVCGQALTDRTAV